MTADDVELHALPLYHCAQLDCFLGAGRLPRRDQRHPARRRPGRDPAPRSSGERVTKFFCPPTVWISLLRHPDFDRTRPVARCARATTAPRSCRSRCCARSQRRLPDVRLWNFYGQTEMAPLATILRPEEQLRKRRLGGPGRAQRRDARRRRRRRSRVPPGEVGEIVHRSPARDARLLPRRGEDRRGVPRRLVPLRRPRRHRRRRLPHRRRPQEGHDQDRRRERRQPRGRGGDLPARRRSPRSRSSASPPALDRGGHRRRRAQGRRRR